MPAPASRTARTTAASIAAQIPSFQAHGSGDQWAGPIGRPEVRVWLLGFGIGGITHRRPSPLGVGCVGLGLAAAGTVVLVIRVALAEDNALLRAGLARLLESSEGIELVGSAADLPSLRRLIDRFDPDVVVTDIRMPPSHSDEGVRVSIELRRDRPSTGVVVLSQHGDPTYAVAILEGGSAGRAYLLKDRVADSGELVTAIRQVAAGGSVIDPYVVEGLVSATRASASDIDRLTPRELEVLGALAGGSSNAAIASSFHLSERAVEKHCSSIFMKLGLSEEPNVNRRVMAVLRYLDRT